MPMDIPAVIEGIGLAIDLAGVTVIALGAAAATIRFALALTRHVAPVDAYRDYRQWLGRAVLLGLELLVAGDIIRTVVIAPTFESVGVLGAIVLIRTFLSFSLEVELGGRWPWARERGPSIE